MSEKWSHKEVVDWVCRKMDEWVGEGFSPADASRIVGKLTKSDPRRLADLYVDRKVSHG